MYVAPALRFKKSDILGERNKTIRSLNLLADTSV